jgi:hypothetical protein
MAVSVNMRARDTARSGRPSWLEIEDVGGDFIVVTVRGSVVTRSTELWASLEEALEAAVGRLVIADLREVVGFDIHTIAALTRVARASARRHLDICALVHRGSALEYYLRCCDVPQLLPTHNSLFTALASVESHASASARE